MPGKDWAAAFWTDKKAFAIDPNYKVVGDAGDVSDEELRFAKDAWTVSDMIIRCDYLGRMNEGSSSVNQK